MDHPRIKFSPPAKNDAFFPRMRATSFFLGGGESWKRLFPAKKWVPGEEICIRQQHTPTIRAEKVTGTNDHPLRHIHVIHIALVYTGVILHWYILVYILVYTRNQHQLSSIKYSTSYRFFSFLFLNHHFHFPAQLVFIGGFTLSDLLDKPWSQVSSSLLPPGTCLQLLSRIGFSVPTARRFLSNVANSRSPDFRYNNFFMQEKVPTSMCTRWELNSRNWFSSHHANLPSHRGRRSEHMYLLYVRRTYQYLVLRVCTNLSGI